jgi:hypothetical protein
LYCLFFDWRLLITPLVSSNFSLKSGIYLTQSINVQHRNTLTLSENGFFKCHMIRFVNWVPYIFHTFTLYTKNLIKWLHLDPCMKIFFIIDRLFPQLENPDDHRKHFLKIKCINWYLDFMNISGILRNSEILNLVPPYFANIETSVFIIKLL